MTRTPNGMNKNLANQLIVLKCCRSSMPCKDIRNLDDFGSSTKVAPLIMTSNMTLDMSFHRRR